METDKQIEKAASLIREADALLIGTGAGMGVDSGLPDFRGNEGLWRAYPKLGKHQISFVEIANPNAFADNARLAWGFYGHRLNRYRETQPHDGFRILQDMAKKLPHGAFVFTSNVDGQFQKAGFDKRRLFYTQGDYGLFQCNQPCCQKTYDNEEIVHQIPCRGLGCRW